MEFIEIILSAIVLGLLAGISPGPMLTLVVSETLKFTRKKGILVAITPLISDPPIILLSVFVVSTLASSNLMLGIIALLGSLFILYLSYESISIKEFEIDKDIKPHSFKKGIVMNLFNPHIYLFWMLVGGPILVVSYKITVLLPFLFLIFFYVFLVGSKIIIAYLTEHSKNFLKKNIYIYIIRALGVALLFFAITFFFEGLKFLRVL